MEKTIEREREKAPSPQRLWKKSIWLLIPGLLGILYFGVQINPLPADEELIAHFQNHRSDIEALVKSYREYNEVDATLWEKNPETLALKRKAEVERVVNTAALWLPNPYSPETDVLIKHTIRAGSGCCFFRRYGSIEIEIDVNRYFRKSLRYPGDYLIWKTLFFYPEAPRIENGWLIGPTHADGKNELHHRVLPSLNSYPPDWKRGECVVRKLDAQWFIRMCRAA